LPFVAASFPPTFFCLAALLALPLFCWAAEGIEIKINNLKPPPTPRACNAIPCSVEGIEIKISDELVSQPYVDMTVKLMERFGVKVGAWGDLCWDAWLAG
jgi:hypothetical protein